MVTLSMVAMELMMLDGYRLSSNPCTEDDREETQIEPMITDKSMRYFNTRKACDLCYQVDYGAENWHM